MAIHYKCRHCGTYMGQLTGNVDAYSLGFHHLNEKERLDVLSYQENGDIQVSVICEDCHESLLRNPDLYELDYFIQ